MKTNQIKLLLQLTLVMILPLMLSAQDIVVSRVVNTNEGKAYLEVDGKPFLYNSVQAWKAPTKEFLMDDYTDLLDKAHEAGYRIFTFWLYWRDLEHEKGRYDWSTLDAMIKRAEELDMRLDIVWGGSNFCGHLDPRFAPDWLLDWDEVHLKDENGKPVMCQSGDFGFTYGADATNKSLLKAEKQMMADIINHLQTNDKKHRVVFFQVLNEINNRGWTYQGMEPLLDYVDELGSVFKKADYKIATRMNVSGKKMFPEIDKLKNIDCYGPDPYTDDIEMIRKLINSPTKMPYIAENAAYKNTTSLMITSFANGGGYNVYMLGPDLVWEKPGIYDLNWEPWEVTYGVYNLNTALNSVGNLIAGMPKSNIIEFNTEDSYPQTNYQHMKSLAGHEVGMKTWGRDTVRNGAVGMAMYSDGYYYMIGDRITWFIFKDIPLQISSGQFDESGKWVENTPKYNYKKEDGFYVPYHAGECLRVKLD
jgi:hypothetical protein